MDPVPPVTSMVFPSHIIDRLHILISFEAAYFIRSQSSSTISAQDGGEYLKSCLNLDESRLRLQVKSVSGPIWTERFIFCLIINNKSYLLMGSADT
jgi:hypothetical protein